MLKTATGIRAMVIKATVKRKLVKRAKVQLATGHVKFGLNAVTVLIDNLRKSGWTTHDLTNSHLLICGNLPLMCHWLRSL